MSKDLYSEITEDLVDRQQWEQRQDTYYRMRNQGLRRRNKPFPGAADLHYPIIDNTIRKLIPFYFNQFAAEDIIADFVAGPKVNLALKEEAEVMEQYFDYVVKEESNLEDELVILIDYMLQCGKGIIKTKWDFEKERLDYSAIDPMYIVVPEYTKDFTTADRITEIIQMSKAQYERKAEYNQDKTFVDSLSSRDTWTNFEKDDSRYDREGITRGHKDQVIVWQTYIKQKEPGEYKVHTFSPNNPNEDVREPFIFLAKDELSPFTEFNMERKEKRWYESRGIAELTAVFEMSACKMWNEKHDAMTYYNRPIYTTDSPMGNNANITMKPGTVFPNGLRRVESGRPAISWDEEMNRLAVISEQTAQVPDFGTRDQDRGNKDKTATQIRAEGMQSTISVDFKARTFRKSLSKVYKKSWGLIQEHSNFEKVSVVINDEVATISQESFESDYRIKPSGSPDTWDKDRQYQKAHARFIELRGDPKIDQERLYKDMLNTDEPGLGQQLWVESAEKAADESEAEAIEIGALLLQGFAAQVKPEEDHAIRAMILVAKIMDMQKTGEQPFHPSGMQLMMQHLEQHLQAAEQANPEQGAQIRQQVEQAFLQAKQLQQQAMQQQAMQQQQPIQQGVPVNV